MGEMTFEYFSVRALGYIEFCIGGHVSRFSHLRVSDLGILGKGTYIINDDAVLQHWYFQLRDFVIDIEVMSIV